jgi:uncharacterized protein YutE (UPF0331/DUF86 family)/predicted nucleotidyltransferase
MSDHAPPVGSQQPSAIVAAIRDCLSWRTEVAGAVLFGSAATGRMSTESDIDVAVYFEPPAAGRESIPGLEMEALDARYPTEDAIWRCLESSLARNVDLVVLNRAPATLAAAAIVGGIPCVMANPGLFARFARAVVSAAEDFRGFVFDFDRIRQRSRSISDIDLARLIRIVSFLESELGARSVFADLDVRRYTEDANLRRNVERWVENLVNCSIDIAKIVVAAGGLPMPQTYRESLMSLGAVGEWRTIAEELSGFARLRNLLAHEYLDLRYPEVRRVVDRADEVFGGHARATRAWIERQAPR